nr:unnamed protein product [Callosobruchus analis]
MFLKFNRLLPIIRTQQIIEDTVQPTTCGVRIWDSNRPNSQEEVLERTTSPNQDFYLITRQQNQRQVGGKHVVILALVFPGILGLGQGGITLKSLDKNLELMPIKLETSKITTNEHVNLVISEVDNSSSKLRKLQD